MRRLIATTLLSLGLTGGVAGSAMASPYHERGEARRVEVARDRGFERGRGYERGFERGRTTEHREPRRDGGWTRYSRRTSHHRP